MHSNSLNKPLTPVSSTEAQTHFGALIRRVYKDGEYIIVERDGLPVAVIMPVGAYEQLTGHNREGR